MAETQPMMLQELCYTAADFRLQLNSLVCDEGVSGVSDGSLLVTTGGAGLDLFVAEGAAFIDSDVDDQGMYSVFNDAQATVTATTADGSNPRIDQVIATVNDSQIIGSDDNWVLSVLPGTATVGATLANLTGAAALPDRSIRLAYILVPTSFAGPFVNATHILDVREPYGQCTTNPYLALEANAVTSTNGTAYSLVEVDTVIHQDRDYFTLSGSTIITVLQAGLYDINAWSGVISGATDDRIAVAIYKNNTNLPNASPNGTLLVYGFAEDVDGFAAGPTRMLVPLAANDTLKLALFQNSGGSLNSVAGSFFNIRKVG